MGGALKTLGCTLILAGIAIGAGMLAIPLVTAAVGFPLAILLLIVCWAVMTLTALLILEVNLAFPNGANFGTMSRQTLGLGGQLIAWIAFIFLLYSAIAAYISGGSAALNIVIQSIVGAPWPDWINSITFTVVLGGVVVLGIRSVDVINRGLMAIKTVAFFVVFLLILPHVDVRNMVSSARQLPYIFHPLPILIVAFSLHIAIPSIRHYIGPDVKRLRLIIVSGCFIPLLVYILWEIITLGVLPLYGADSFQDIATRHGSIDDMILNLQQLAHDESINFFIDIFINVALTTSFLGASTSLLDFLTEAVNLNSTKFSNRLIAGLLTFTPPLLFALFYPKGFVLALGYASIFVAILLIILPPLMVLKLRRQNRQQPYRTWQTTPILWLLVAFGICLIVIQILDSLYLLPLLH